MGEENKTRSRSKPGGAGTGEAQHADVLKKGKRIVVFADGTGNAFTQQESNVWRLYQSLDRSKPDQIARYIQGVGTSGNSLLAKLDGATGFGVPSNVRKLYRFICWNWEPGDEIFMFGFSRGSFTIRTLASLIHNQGLMPAEIDGKPVSRADMRANAMGAWRQYRSNTVKLRRQHLGSDIWKVSPTVGIARLVRDGLVWVFRRIMRRKPHREVEAILEDKQPRRLGGSVSIRFLGLFDTVEAYGVPIEELRKPIDYLIWPMSFRNRICSEAVQTVRHALSIDDERKTFHPVRFDQTPRDSAGTEISEVWFSGMHSDVGGGYPDDSLAFTPLCWMAREARSLELRFRCDNLNYFYEHSSVLAHIHNSRKGMKAFYRYSPRRITTTEADGGDPVVHNSVIQKIVFGSEGYAPTTLPDTFEVQMSDESIRYVERSDDQEPSSASSEKKQEEELKPDAAAMQRLRAQRPSLEGADIVRNLVVLRRLAYYALIICVIYLAFLPVLGGALSYFGLDFEETRARSWARILLDWVANFTPGFLQPWLDAFRENPISALLLIGLAALFYSLNTRLSNRIKDTALSAWDSKRGSPALPGSVRFFVDLVRRLRLHKVGEILVKFKITLIPAIAFVALLLVAVAVAANWLFVTGKTASGGFCPQQKLNWVELRLDASSHSKAGFLPSSRCWATGVKVVEGRTYTLWIDQRTEDNEPFVDHTIPVGAAPFKSSGWRHRLMAPTFRRWTGADWFQPIVQIGAHAEESFPLKAIDGQPPLLVPRDGLEYETDNKLAISDTWQNLSEQSRKGFKEKLLLLNEKPTAFGGDVGIPLIFSARFEAPASGELYLYVNDVLIMWDRRIFYENNTGSATVTVRMEAIPNLPKVQP
ncbi:DUF2235 domain-containing protein [Hoeflea prorocentri]|uniref:DUF2235 domain-containing protein n=1 Tax=Hoeflea prorocentri TaxID=1922333 RepID=A0A9X3UP96_9HYPH|nr:DUF2235 domain-containing protein [Hoeflea prorocentri]MCY6382701.1 DUF2235 domain-containing protein [Hoeflea prorocentri]MDA5400501.1 DUF2235 domain-containing protein [Hoeflea prorocentri]